ncbi:OTU domain containing protein [Heterostelium album PN500]|uniref:OTU domain containing protein n=1 Tax=Heterostelium pallidum (strain ATCC 26659 / Pp 5 / PN500) TaxID=670386 RepID=D3BL09_HETP5|nr:OTU domain containing protein [Heterostelium album PN500]EFA78589.1 OTU domain containing protein [Heterostelium album PN500]|eukprot:XP_020430713.1 OTU domain containing protein [Heterostelium album PN500]
MGKKKPNKLLVVVDDDKEEDDNVVQKKEEEEGENEKVGDDVENDEDNDDDDDSKLESKGKMVQRHKMELKKLQQQIDKMAHSVPKKDKKAKDEMAVKTKKMEDELLAKHKQEMSRFDEEQKKVEQGINDLLISNNSESKGPSKTQLKKQKKLEEEEARAKQLEEDRKNHISKGSIEFADFAKKLTPLSLTLKHIRSDGDCLYNAIANQLLVNGAIAEKDINGYQKKLRLLAANYIRANTDEFLPFVLAEDDFEESDNPVEEYCQSTVLKDGKWGGHLELKAISHSLKTPIVIYNAYSPDIIIGEEFFKPATTTTTSTTATSTSSSSSSSNNNQVKPINLSYHKHAFTLGEHYNSVIPLPPATTTTDE